MKTPRIAATIAVAALCSFAPAQSPRFEHLEGGFLTWPWVWQDPGDPDHYVVWTSEDGARIRRTDVTRVAPGTFRSRMSFEPSAGAEYTGIFRHIRMFEDGSGAITGGIAVGDNGQWSWTVSNLWRNQAPRAYQGAATPQDLRDTATTQDAIWVVGSAGLIQRVTLLGSPVVGADTVFSAGSLDPAAANLTLRAIDCIELQGGGVRCIAVGDVAPDRMQGMIYWSDDGIRWTNATFGTTPDLFPDRLSLFDVEFVPGNPDVAYAVGGVEDKNGPGFVYVTLDGGRTWTQEEYASSCGACPPAPCPPPDATLPATCSGTDLHGSISANAFMTLYGVHAFSDCGAVAVGYGAQVVRRNPCCSTTSACGDPWEDVSWNCDYAMTPLWGVHGTGDDDTVVLSGMFNSLRISDDRGADAQHLGWDKFWRLGEICFIDEDTGWTAGFLHRIALTTDGGETWTEQLAEYAGAFDPSWKGIAFQVDGAGLASANGVVVGAPTLDEGHAVLSPSIKYTVNGGVSCGWLSPSLPLNTSGKVYNDVECSGTGSSGNEFWAVGPAYVLHSRDGGASWEIVPQPEPGGPGSKVDWEGVAFTSLDVGFFVGHYQGVGRAYLLTDATSPSRSWSEIPICWRTSPSAPCAATAPMLKAVGAWDRHVYAVGKKGSVLHYTSLAGFEAVDDAIGLTNRKLLSVEVVPDDSGSFEVFVGGAGGVLINRRKHGTRVRWDLMQSRTSSSLTGLSFPSFDLGYAIGGRGLDMSAQTTIVKYE